MLFGANCIWRILPLAVCGALSVSAQPVDFDIDLTNRNFKALLGQRLNNFPKPQYVRNIRLAFNNNRLGFDFKFITAENFNQKYENDGILTNPFVRGDKTVFVIVYEGERDKLVAALDRGHASHEEATRSIDLGLLAVELIFEMTTEARRNDIFGGLAQISKMPEGEPKQKIVMGMLAKHFPASKVVRFFLTLRLRLGEIYPGVGLLESINFILDDDVKDMLSKFISDNLMLF